MSASKLSTIAQLLCFEDLPVNFAKLVGDLDSVLERLRGVPHRVSWDCDDVATFDLPGTRILLGWTEAPGQGLVGILTLSVGPSPFVIEDEDLPDYNALCARLVNRLQEQVRAPGVLWHQIDCMMTAEWVDTLIEALPDLPDMGQTGMRQTGVDLTIEPNETPISALRAKLEPKPTRPAPKARGKPANSTPDLPRSRDEELTRLRAALYADEQPVPYSVPMRLAVHAMNATLIMVWLPLGVTAMTHGLVKGEDMRLASRLMVLTGSVAALAQTPIGQQMVALARL